MKTRDGQDATLLSTIVAHAFVSMVFVYVHRQIVASCIASVASSSPG